MTLKVKVNDLHFHYQLRVSQGACLEQIWWIKPKFVMVYHTYKPHFLEFWVKMVKMTLKVKVNDLHFQYQLRVSQDACLVQIWWLQLKYVMSYCADTVKFTDRRMDGRTDGQTDRWNNPFGLKSQGVMTYISVL